MSSPTLKSERLTTLCLSAILATVILGCRDEAPRGPGAIQVLATASSAEGQFFPFGVSVNGDTPRMGFVGTPLSFTQTGLAHGTHTLTVTGVQAPCTGAEPRDVVLRGDDTARVVITINCPRTTGDISVAASSTGSDIDPGYFVMLDGMLRGFVLANGNSVLGNVSPGQHTVSLSDVASNCTASGPQVVTVSVGALASASFTVTCAPVAVLRFVASFSGVDLDPDGVTVRVDSGVPERVLSGQPLLLRPSAGAHTYQVGDLQPNCTLAGALSDSVMVPAGDTLTVSLTATCAAIPLGTAGVTVTDPVNDTITSSLTGSTLPHDLVSITARHDPAWLSLTLRFARPITTSAGQDAQGLHGYLELDTDENEGTGATPIANVFGASASLGVDYIISFFGSDSVSVPLVSLSSVSPELAGRVIVKFPGDSTVVLHIPLAKFGADDGNVGMVTLVGTRDRPTDMAPNTGSIAVHKPSGVIAASGSPIGAAARPSPTQGAPVRPMARRTWGRLP